MAIIEELRNEIERLESMSIEEAVIAYNMDGEDDRQALLADMRKELAYEERLQPTGETYDIDELCPRYSGQYAY